VLHPATYLAGRAETQGRGARTGAKAAKVASSCSLELGALGSAAEDSSTAGWRVHRSQGSSDAMEDSAA